MRVVVGGWEEGGREEKQVEGGVDNPRGKVPSVGWARVGFGGRQAARRELCAAT